MSTDVTSLTLLTFRAATVLAEAGDRMVQDLGLTRARWQVLGALAMLGAPSTVSQIARAMSLSRQAVQRTADDLSKAGLAQYRRNPGQARADLLAFTEAGQGAHAEAMRRQAAWSAELAQGLDGADLRVARRVLAALTQRAEMADTA